MCIRDSDTSKKIRAVKQAQAQKGERVNGEYPYGYIPDPNNRHQMCIRDRYITTTIWATIT